MTLATLAFWNTFERFFNMISTPFPGGLCAFSTSSSTTHIFSSYYLVA